MPVQVVIAAVALAVSLPVLWWSVAGSRSPAASQDAVRNLTRGRTVTDLRQLLLARSAGERAVLPAARAVAERVRKLALERRIKLAGVSATWRLERVLAAKLLLGLGALLLGVWQLRVHRSTAWLLLTLVGTAGGYFLPDLLLSSRARERQKRIQQALPDTLDQLTISVEAGLGFEAALARVSRAGRGPLPEELTRTLQDVQIGVPRPRALRNLIERTDVPDLRHFVLAILQAENYGVPIAQVLRVQAAELRVKRRQRAEERAMKVPVKIIFPIAFCVFPSLFIVLLGPAAIRIYRALVGVIS
ncbi:MAG: type II secretion system F family protein [Acidimicrobiia bacterium]